MNRQGIKGDSTLTKAKLRDDDLQYESGIEKELLGRIQQRTGAFQQVSEKELKLPWTTDWSHYGIDSQLLYIAFLGDCMDVMVMKIGMLIVKTIPDILPILKKS